MDAVEELLLKHADVPYDPVQRRLYYLRTRQLKGRDPKGELEIAKLRKGLPKQALQKALVRKAPTPQKGPVNNRKEVEQRRARIEAKVKVLNEKLKRLREVLKGLKDASNKHNPSADKQKQEDKKTQERKNLTPAQKREAAKKAQERRDKEALTRPTSPDQRLKEVMDKISDIQKQIKAAREKLRKGQ